MNDLNKHICGYLIGILIAEVILSVVQNTTVIENKAKGLLCTTNAKGNDLKTVLEFCDLDYKE